MTDIYIALAVVLAIGVSYRTKINAGLIAMVFAYIIAVFDLKLDPDKAMTLWPVTVFFEIFTVTLFFAVAIENGTLKKVVDTFLYRFRGLTWGLAFVFLFAATLIGALGGGFFTVMVLLCPIALLVASQVKIEPLLAGIAVTVGASAGSNFMTSLSGIVYRGLFEKFGYSSSRAFTISVAIFIAYLVLVTLMIGGLMLYFRRRARHDGSAGAESITMPRPEPFDRSQRITLGLTGVFLLLALVPSIIHMVAPDLGWAEKLTTDLDVTLVTLALAVLAMILGIVDREAVLQRVPWKILIMVTGMGMLMQVAIAGGTLDDLAHWLGDGALPTFLIPLLLALVAAVITSFGSWIGVTAPALFPVVPLIAHLTGLSPELLFVCATIGGLSVEISPYSAAGAMVLGFSPKDQQDAMYRKELTIGLPTMGLSALVATVVLTAVWQAIG